MPSILSDLYRGNYAVFNRNYNPDCEYVRISSELSDLEDEIDRALTGELKEKFRKYTNLSVQLNMTGGEGDFIEGFRLCARLMGEAMRTE